MRSNPKKRLKSRVRQEKFTGRQFISMVYVVLQRHYPDFDSLLNAVPDHRKRKTYEVAELIMAGLCMFIFKRGSRNQADLGVNAQFEQNYFLLWGKRVPVMDTLDVFLRKLPAQELEKLKSILVKRLIENKVMEKWKYHGHHAVAIDGTGNCSYDYEPYPGCPHRTSKNGVTTYHAYVIEAKLVSENGWSISLASEWLTNEEDIDKKQDCERKAFLRLAKKIKKTYPRLPILLLADGLYANQTVFEVCRKNNWRFILTFKEGNLKSIWEEVGMLAPLHLNQKLDRIKEKHPKKGWMTEQVFFINNLDYLKYKLNWMEYRASYAGEDPHEYFCYITDIKMDKDTSWGICAQGRTRWCIENQGFNTQKNGGYNLQHKFSRKNLQAKKNYYELLQIGHLINQLVEKLKRIKDQQFESKQTLSAITADMICCMRKETIEDDELADLMEEYKQLRY